jgi:hypothetical protein
MVGRFMSGILEHPPGEVYVDAAFRTILSPTLWSRRA